MAGRAEESQIDGQWRTAGDRIQTLLEATSAGGVAARERAEQLVSEVVELYGAALARIVDLIGNSAVIDRLAADDLVASLLLVHGLHPHDLRRRVSDALERVRPYLGSHGGDVHLLEIIGDTVQLEFAGSCKGCPSSAVTLQLTVEDAIRTAAPEISSIEVVSAEPESTSTVIPAASLFAKIHADGSRSAAWYQVPELAELTPGEVGGFEVADTVVLACRVGEQVCVYRDHCPVCDGSLAGAELCDALLRCPRCHNHFDAVHAGAGLDDVSVHLDPLPLLVRDGVPSLALPAEAIGAPA